MPKLYIMCGYPFAGKSTIAHELVKQFDLVRVALDDINASRGIGVDLSKPISKEDWQITYDIHSKLITGNLATGKSVLTDTVAHKKENRDNLQRLAKEHSSEAVIIFVDTPLKTVTQRWQNNRQTKERPDVRDDIFYKVTSSFEIPSNDEDAITITPNMTTDVVVELISAFQ